MTAQEVRRQEKKDALAFFRAKKARASGRNVGKVFQPCFEAGIRELPFLMPEPAEKPSLHTRTFAIETLAHTEIVATYM